MVGLIKPTVIAGAIAFVLVGIFVGITFLALALVPGTQWSADLGASMFITGFVILWLEASRFVLLRTFAIDKEKLAEAKRQGVFAQIGRAVAIYYRYSDLFSAALFSLLVLTGIGFWFYTLFKHLSAGEIVVTRMFYIQAGIYAAYFLILRKILSVTVFRWLVQGYEALGKKIDSVPTYTVEQDGVLIDFKVKQLFVPKEKKKPYIAKVFFSEIDEIRLMDYYEAAAFVKYQIGPDLALGLQNLKDFNLYIMGKIPRPETYFRGGGVDGKVLLIKGPRIFYLIAIAKDEIGDLLAAFNDYKSKN